MCRAARPPCHRLRLHHAERRCDIWYSADFPPSPEIVRHERLHCAGYDHIGASAMKDLLVRHSQVLARTPGTRPSN